MQTKAMIAMSGGVDSSVSAALMTEAGYRCIGVTMRLYENDDIGRGSGRTCCSAEDAQDAASVAARLGMPYYVFDFSKEFRARVMDPFAQAYLEGVTPNPCIDCNRYMKFELLYERARTLGCEKLATGHYARIRRSGQSGRYELWKGADAAKDQSYVLYMLTQEQLPHIAFPLGEYRKTQVRELALARGFLNAEKRDSQDICFVPDGRYEAFIRRHTKRVPPEGNFVNEDGEVLGRHRGIQHYTIGQRRGLGISSKEPLYVRTLRTETNEVVLGGRETVFSDRLTAGDFHWISGETPEKALRVQAKIRYRQQEQDATAYPLDGRTVEVRFDAPQRAVTRGQAVVLYDGERVLGGGTIL